jgi:hypothetical protein
MDPRRIGSRLCLIGGIGDRLGDRRITSSTA